MSLHLGNDFVISTKQIVSIINLRDQNDDASLCLKVGKKNFDRRRKLGPGPYRAAILCCKGTIYLSPIDATTLARRFKHEILEYIK